MCAPFIRPSNVSTYSAAWYLCQICVEMHVDRYDIYSNNQDVCPYVCKTSGSSLCSFIPDKRLHFQFKYVSYFLKTKDTQSFTCALNLQCAKIQDI